MINGLKLYCHIIDDCKIYCHLLGGRKKFDVPHAGHYEIKVIKYLGLLNESHPGVFQMLTLPLFKAF